VETLSSAEEQRLLENVKRAVDLADNHNLSPDAALTKVAQEAKWTPGHLRAAVSAFNNGRQVAQWGANTNIFDKLAEFPLADYDAIKDAVWGKAAAEKQAAERRGIDPEYAQPPGWRRDPYREMLLGRSLKTGFEKTAADQAIGDPDPWVPVRRAYHARAAAQRTFEDARTKFSHDHDLLRVQVKLLEGYFRKSAMDRLAFPAFDAGMRVYHGAAGKRLADILAAGLPREKRAADADLYASRPLDRASPPFTYAAKAIALAQQIYYDKQAMDKAYQGLEQAAEALRPFASTPSPQQGERLSASLLGTEKAAGLGEIFMGGVGHQMLSKQFGGKAKDDIQDMSLDLEDPEHENELRKIRQQVVLNNILSDPENPISGHDPEEVLQAFNDISKMTPRAAEQPLALQTELAKRLSGNMEPFEIKDMNEIEKGLQKTHGSPLGVGLLGNAAFNDSGESKT
jgi:hypothetical protein